MNVTLLLILLLAGAVATYFSGNKIASRISLLFSVMAAVLSFYFLNQYNQGANLNYLSQWMTKPNVSVAFTLDGLSMAMLLLTTTLTPLIILSSFKNEFQNAKSIYALILFMEFAMIGTFLATDGLLYYVFWELALIPIYFIALIWGIDDAEKRKKAVQKFFIITLGGSLFMLTALLYLYQKTHSFLVQSFYNTELSATEQFWIFFGFFLAYAIKIPIIPFHTWQANVYQKAPTVGTMLLSGIMLKMGLYSVLRWQVPIAPLAAKQYLPIVLGFCIAGVIYGSIVALRQKNLKKLFAYSSLAHVGLIAAGCYSMTIDGMSGAVAQMIAHGYVIVGLFFAAEIVFRRYNTWKIKEMGGIRQQAPKFVSLFLILVLASVAMPGTYNFVGEFTVLFSMFQINIWYAIFAGLTIILGAYYMLRMFQHVMLGESQKIFEDITTSEIVVLVIIAAFLLGYGIYPKPITELVKPAIENLFAIINR